MRKATTGAALAAALLLTACGTSTPRLRAPAPSPSQPASPSPAYDSHRACWAFRQATTKGVPASAAGEDTMTWLQAQTGQAPPDLKAAVRAFVAAWQGFPPSTRKISRASRRIRALCR